MQADCTTSIFNSSIIFYCYHDHRDLHSFPTRRSSDLSITVEDDGVSVAQRQPLGVFSADHDRVADGPGQRILPLIDHARSEEHTSELQSRQYLVCRLLLEKKK